MHWLYIPKQWKLTHVFNREKNKLFHLLDGVVN